MKRHGKGKSIPTNAEIGKELGKNLIIPKKKKSIPKPKIKADNVKVQGMFIKWINTQLDREEWPSAKIVIKQCQDYGKTALVCATLNLFQHYIDNQYKQDLKVQKKKESNVNN